MRPIPATVSPKISLVENAAISGNLFDAKKEREGEEREEEEREREAREEGEAVNSRSSDRGERPAAYLTRE